MVSGTGLLGLSKKREDISPVLSPLPGLSEVPSTWQGWLLLLAKCLTWLSTQSRQHAVAHRAEVVCRGADQNGRDMGLQVL